MSLNEPKVREREHKSPSLFLGGGKLGKMCFLLSRKLLIRLLVGLKKTSSGI
jgi:hypothetical protein